MREAAPGALALGVLTIVACATAPSRGAGDPDGGGAGSREDASDDRSAAPASDGAAGVGPLDASTEATYGTPAGDAGWTLSDGFEDAAVGGPPDPALWTVASIDCSGAGKLAVDGSQAHGGRRSVRVDGGGGYCDHVFFGNTTALAAVGPQVYARFYVRLGAALGAGHVTFLAMKDTADGGKDLRMGGQDMILMYNRQSDDATLPVLSPAGVGMSLAPAVSAWICIELHVDQAAGTIDTWVDGTEVAGLVENGAPVPDVSTQWLAQAWRPSLADFRLGWESYAGQAMTLWFDDVALADHRIGCGT